MKCSVCLMLCFLFYLPSKGKNSQSSIPNGDESNPLKIEISEYGLIFTDILVNGQEVKAMIDFGDMHRLQLSSSLTDRLGIETRKTNALVFDIQGNSWELYEGIAPKVQIGSWSEDQMTFTSQIGEMEAVSEQIGTEFNAVLGWGYFQEFFTEIDYDHESIILYQNKPVEFAGQKGIPFSMQTGQLLFPIEINGKEELMMLDTGSPVTLLGVSMDSMLTDGLFAFRIQNQDFQIPAYIQDLSALDDLNIMGILGGDFLSLVKLYIDPNHQKIYVKRNP